MSCKLTRLKSYVEESLSTVYLQDRYLIVNTTRIQGRGRPGHVSERAIVFRFGHYLTQALAGDELLSAYDMLRSLVGSEMCIRNRNNWMTFLILRYQYVGLTEKYSQNRQQQPDSGS